MSDVTVIGLGEMGGALARAFLRSGRTVTVWNRSPDKASALVSMGAAQAATVAGAIAASPVLVICLADYAASALLLQQATLAGRLVVQLSSGTPGQAREFDAMVRGQGATYLDGAIAAWPRQIGGPEAGITIVGPEAVFSAAEPLLKQLASLSYAGADVGHAAALSNAALSYFAGHWIGFSHGAAICEAEGLDVAQFGDMMAGISPYFADDMRHMAKVISEGSFDQPESSLRTAAADIARMVDVSADRRLGTAFPEFAAGVFRRAVAAGYGGEEYAAVIKVLRTA